LILVLAGRVDLTFDQRRELRALVNSSEVAASVATRARIVLWWSEGRAEMEISALAGGVSCDQFVPQLRLLLFRPERFPAESEHSA
jgi:hypothetical protein